LGVFAHPSEEEILSGMATDIYFLRTKEVLEKEGLGGVEVRAEVHVYGLPDGYDFAVVAGVSEAVRLFEEKPVTVYTVRDGTIVRDRWPIMLIEGPYASFATLETSLLGILRHYTSIATKAARIKMAAGGKTVLFFGLRCVHPLLQVVADKAALMGGVDGVSGALSKKYIGVEPTGTMPHSLMIVFGDQRRAWSAFDRHVDSAVPRIVLVDTFFDEREEALMAAKLLGDRLRGVRLDTPSSRRGNMRKIVEEVRWTLDIHGYRHVKIFVSGGIDEREVAELRDVVDGFGVGTSIAMPKSVDISMDIVEVKEGGSWVPRTKRGKLPGARAVYECADGSSVVVKWGEEPKCPDGSTPTPLMEIAVDKGKVVYREESVLEIRERVLKKLLRRA